MAKRIQVSFKEKERDQKLYAEISRRSDYSAFIKDCIEFYLNYYQGIKQISKQQTNINVIDAQDDDENILDSIIK